MERQPAPTSARRRPNARVALVAALLVGVLAGCGLRLETPPPAEPVPDALEQVRRTAVADALGVADLAASAQQAEGLPEPVSAELARVATDAHAQVDALGGPYESGLEPDDDLDLPPEESAPAPPATPADVVGTLSDAAGRNRTAATTTSSGDLARLLASVGASQAVSAARLATLAGLEVPEPVVPVMPAPGTATPPPASPTPTPVATTPPGGEESVLPAGLTASDFQSLVLSEDGARYALEVRAARTSGDDRARLLTRSRLHGERAQAWADLGSIAGSAQDPRRVAYAIPRADDDPTLVRALETGLGTSFATLVGTTAPMTRGLLVDLLVESALTLDAWGAPPLAFPGLPEQLP